MQWMVLSTVAVWIFGIISNYMLFGPLKLDTISKFFGCFICFGCMYLREKGAGFIFFILFHWCTSKIVFSMSGFPVTIRLLDPPLHEFLPEGDLEQIVSELTTETGMMEDEVLSRIEKLSEVNPMLGFRGCRFGGSSYVLSIYCFH